LYNLLKTTKAYQNLPAHAAQQVLRLLDQNWNAFFITIKDWWAHPEKYLGRPRLPRYKPKNGESIVIFTNQQCRIRNGFLIFPKKAQVPPIKTRIVGRFRQIRLLPRGNHYLLEIVYEKTPVNFKLDSRHVISIDLGLNNFITVVNNAGLPPWRVKGGVVKSINRYYNKERARLTSLLNQQSLVGPTIWLQCLRLKRSNKITDFFHKVSRRVINYCLNFDFDQIVI